MPQALYFMPPRGPFVDPVTGHLTRAADIFLRGIYARIGGTSGASIDDLSASAFDDAGIAEQGMALAVVADAAGQAPTVVVHTLDPETSAEVATLREQVADLQRQINDIKQGLTA